MGSPPSDLHFWGADPGLRRLAIGSVGNGTRTWAAFDREATGRVGPENLNHTLRELYRQSYRLATDLAENFPPIFVLVEQPSGQHRNLRLAYATGIIIDAITAALEAHYGISPIVDLVNGSTWKKQMLGRGNARPIDYTNDARTRFGAQVPANADVCAALWIAEYASTLEVRNS